LQKLTQVFDYDIWYIDNFYDDPDQIRNYALSLNFSRSNYSPHPGIRSRKMSLKDNYESNYDLEVFYLKFLNLLKQKIDIFNIDNFFDIETTFHKIWNFSNNFDSILNTGFIHIDLLESSIIGKQTFAGLVYLNKKTCPNSGTSFFKMKCTQKDKIKITECDNFELFNSLFKEDDIKLFHSRFDNIIDNDKEINYEFFFKNYAKIYNSPFPKFIKKKYLNEFLNYKKIVDSKFDKVVEVENVYNRLVIYDSNYFHTASNFYIDDFQTRLTQPFFITMS